MKKLVTVKDINTEVCSPMRTVGNVECVCVKIYGAAGDGVTDDAAAIQLAINATSSVFKESNETMKKPIYTQAMADANELPPVGSECLALFFTESGNEQWLDVRILMFNKSKTAACYIIDGIFDGKDLLWSNEFKPIDTRTDEGSKLTHGNAYQFTNVENNVIHGIYDEDEDSFKSLHVEWTASNCTDIKILT